MSIALPAEPSSIEAVAERSDRHQRNLRRSASDVSPRHYFDGSKRMSRFVEAPSALMGNQALLDAGRQEPFEERDGRGRQGPPKGAQRRVPRGYAKTLRHEGEWAGHEVPLRIGQR